MPAIKDALALLTDVIDPQTGQSTGEGAGGRQVEKHAVLALAWHAWLKTGKVKPNDVELTYDKVMKEKKGIDVLANEETQLEFGGIDLGEGRITRTVEQDVTETDAEQAKAAARKAKQEADKAKILKIRSDKAAADGKSEEPEPPTLAEQVAALQAQHPGKILIFRTVAGYNFWGKDAEEAGRLLKAKPFLDGGLMHVKGPIKDFDGVIKRLLELGKQVVVCDQVAGKSVVSDVADLKPTAAKIKPKATATAK